MPTARSPSRRRPRCRKASSTPMAVVVGQVDQPPLPGLVVRARGCLPDRQDGPADHRRLVHARRPEPAAAQRPQPNTTHVPSLTALDAQRRRSRVNQSPPARSTRRRRSSSRRSTRRPPTTSATTRWSTSASTTRTSRSSSPRRPSSRSNPVLDPTGNFILDYTGQVNLTFLPGLPAGNYEFVAHTTELQFPGLTDAAGNPLDDTTFRAKAPKTSSSISTSSPSPSTSRAWRSRAATRRTGRRSIGGEQSYFELPPTGGREHA